MRMCLLLVGALSVGVGAYAATVPDLKADLSRKRLWAQRCTPTSGEDTTIARHQHDRIIDTIARLDRAADRAWQGLSPAEIRARQRQIRADWIKAVGGMPERTPLNPVVTGRVQRKGYVVEKVLMESRPKHYLTAHLYLPDDPKFKPPYACVVVPCGHSITGKLAPVYQRMGVIQAQHGLAAIVYDPVDQGERDQTFCKGERILTCSGHDVADRRAELLGWDLAQFRIFDGFRVFDYLETRADIDKERLGVSGMSGGGTLSTYLMALEPRAKAAAPAGYLGSMRDLCRFVGPQDGEQNIFGQLRFGLNHLAMTVLRAPTPELICYTSTDFNEASAAENTCDVAREVYAALGAPTALVPSRSRGMHGWYESQKTRDAAWFRYWLKGEKDAWPPDSVALDRLDVGFSFTETELAFRDPNGEEGHVVKGGWTSQIPGSRTVYDILREEADRQAAARGKLKAEDVRRVTGIRPADEIAFVALAERETACADGLLVRDAILSCDDGTLIPTLTVSSVDRRGKPVLYVSDALELGEEAETVRKLVAEGRSVTLVSPRFCGETAICYPRWAQDRAYAARWAAGMMNWLGESIVGARAEDVAVAAKWLKDRTGQPVETIAHGHGVVPTLHAWHLEPQLFAARPALKDPPPSWRETLAGSEAETEAEDIVYGAYRHYDWTDL